MIAEQIDPIFNSVFKKFLCDDATCDQLLVLRILSELLENTYVIATKLRVASFACVFKFQKFHYLSM